MLEADDVGTWRDQLHLDRLALDGHIELGHAMDMSAEIPLGRGGGIGRGRQP